MGMLMKLPKEDNTLYCDFNNAYWCIEDIRFGTDNGVPVMAFNWNCYPSREAKQKNLYPIEPSLRYGGPDGIAYNPLLHEFREALSTEIIFPNGIPLSEKDQKDAVYSYIKKKLELKEGEYTDVFEEDPIK